MKRKDMILIMAIRYNYCLENPESFPDVRNKMDWILKGMEEHGMLPPMYVAWPDVECCELNEWESKND